MNRLSFFTLCFFFIAFLPLLPGQEKVKIWEEPLTLPTYVVRPPDKNPMFFRNQSYQGASRYVYPYALEDNITEEKVDKTYKALYLENEYIKLCVLPEIGGRLFYATDKTNGYELFYRQHVIKPANIGMLGAWISGGIEFCVFHHHRASTNIPVDYRLVQNEDGSATIWIGETEPRHRMKWSLGISLYPGKSYIEVDGRLFNPTSNTNSILYWANVATHVNDDYQIIFPPSTDFAVYHAKNSFTRWPVTSGVYNGKEYYRDGIDAGWWKNHPEPISMFAHDLQDGFLAGYDHGRQAGTMHVANPHIVKGAKLWEWGPGPYGSMWDTEVLTDSDGPYAELMTGAYSDNQPDYSWLMPYETKTFKQYWYPLRETQGAVAANLEATLNLNKQEEGNYLVAVNTTRPHRKASLLIKAGKEVLFQTDIDISPETPFHQVVELPAGIAETDLRLQVTDAAGAILISYEPAVKDPNPPLPEPVAPPLAPSDVESLEELYFTGLRIRQFHNARIDAEAYFREALRRDPLDSRCNTMMGIIRQEACRLEAAADHFRTALRRPTANYTRPRDGEALYHLGVILQQQGKYSAAYDTLYRAAWDQAFAPAAYFHLAQLSTGRGDYRRALTEVDRALGYNASHLRARNLRASILRRLGQAAAAAAQCRQVLEQDPLNAYALQEQLQLGGTPEQALTEALRDQPESYLELATKYLNAGLREEAASVLRRASASDVRQLRDYPTIHYYQGYLAHLAEKTDVANRHFAKGQALPTDYCFPYRFESIAVFEAALQYDTTDARAHYYLGNLLYDKQPDRAISHWERAVQLEPELAIAHRNLGWGYQQHHGDPERAIRAYETAIQHQKQDPRYYLELDKLYEKQGADLEKRYAVLTGNHEYVARRPDALLQEIKVLTLYGKSEQAIDYLVDDFFPRQEGVDNLHDIYVDACLAEGLTELEAGRRTEALRFFEMADEYPANHQIARNPSYPRNAQIKYLQALAKDKKAATALFREVAGMEVRDPRYQYYQALALQQLGRETEAAALARSIRTAAEELLQAEARVDFFSKFGEGQSEQARQAEGDYLQALFLLLTGEKAAAREDLKKAARLDPGHLWARLQLREVEH